MILRLVLLLILAFPANALAVEPDEILNDPRLEERAREISADLRCLVCQNQSIDDSDAELARDLRILVRERLEAGDTNAEVLEYIVARYGEFVLLRPVMAQHTLALWIAAPAVFIAGAVLLIFSMRRRPEGGTSEPLTEEERAALAALKGDNNPRAGDRN